MHRDLIDILACPVDKAPLALAVEQADGDDVVSGLLTCTACDAAYPIQDSIPNLLPPGYPG
ncbi:MAG: methytransferase partner Trm112 [Chloroflexota bacterium]|nr:methytransferase partner Trm112 [Chloroflexota bacterium]MDE2883477.1 methytransferase partner Trm112 [Chloroflexota bacterium]